MGRREWGLLLAAVAALLAVRLPFLPTALEDIDSVNFHLGVHEFYPYAYQPHPPGYPVFIALARLVHPFLSNHASALALPSAVFGALAIVPLYVLLRALIGIRAAAIAAILVVCNPVFWMNGVRPMSDVTGFAITTAAQCLLVLALRREATGQVGRHLWTMGAALAGIALGVRIQAGFLVAPILAFGLWQQPTWRLKSLGVFAAAVLAWIVPTVRATGGATRLITKQIQVIAEALPAEPLLQHPTGARAVEAAIDTFVRPWATVAVAAIVLGAAVVGVGVLLRRDRRMLALLALLFLPYAAAHYALQFTYALRYTIPLLPLVAALAGVGAVALVRGRVLGMSLAVVAFVWSSSAVVWPAIHAYSERASPPLQAVAYLRDLSVREPGVVVAGHHMFARYLPKLGDAVRVIKAEPHQEWRALNRYWVSGGTRPVWFLRDPDRSTLRLVDAKARTLVASWQWSDGLRGLLQGARPTHVELVRIDPPRWFAEGGAFLSGEAATPERMRLGPHLLFVRTTDMRQQLVLAGTTDQPGEVSVSVGSKKPNLVHLESTFGLSLEVPSREEAGVEYAPVRLNTTASVRVTEIAVVPIGTEWVQPLRGFFPIERQERSPAFRWMGPKATALVARTGTAIRVSLDGMLPAEHLSLPLTLQVSADGQPIETIEIHDATFTVAFVLPETRAKATTELGFRVSASFVPAVVEGTGDERELSMRVYDLRAEPIEKRTPKPVDPRPPVPHVWHSD